MKQPQQHNKSGLRTAYRRRNLKRYAIYIIEKLMTINLPKRSSSHVLESESEKAFLNAIPNEWVVEKPSSDYGIDFEIEIYDASRTTGVTIAVQLKAHSSINLQRDIISQKLSVSTINYLMLREFSLLVVYSQASKTLRYTILQFYVEDVLSNKKPHWIEQKYTTIHIPRDNVLDKKAIIRLHSALIENNGLSGYRKHQELLVLRSLPGAGYKSRVCELFLSETDEFLVSYLLQHCGDYIDVNSENATRLIGFLNSENPSIASSSCIVLEKFPSPSVREAIKMRYKTFNERVLKSWDWEDTKWFLKTLIRTAGEIAEGDDEWFAWMLLNEFVIPERMWIAREAGGGLLKLIERGTPDMEKYILKSLMDAKRDDIRFEHRTTFPQGLSAAEIIKYICKFDYDTEGK
jgi:Domain of unknown function (DUF4365)